MTSPPLISLVVTMHNRADLIERCLESIVRQEYAPLEVLLVDNDSTDATREVAQDWILKNEAKATARQCYFRLLDEAQKGADYARRRGLQAAQGQWVAFFDDDDEFSPDFFPAMLSALEKQPTARWILARTCMVMPDGTTHVREGWPCPSLAEHLLASLISTQSFLARREWLISLQAWEPHLTLWNDYYLGALMLLHEPQPAWCPKVFHRIYQHAESLTGTRLSSKCLEVGASLRALQCLLEKAQQKRWASSSQLQAAQRALYLRTQWVLGRFRQEGNTAAIKAVQALLAPPPFVFPNFIPPLWLQCVGKALAHYTAWGGRGAWRIALIFCR